MRLLTNLLIGNMHKFLTLSILLNLSLLGGVFAQGHHHAMSHHVNTKPKSHVHKKNYLNAIKLAAGIGYSAYQGDLSQSKFSSVPRPSVQFGINYRVNERFMIRGDIAWIRLFGQDTKDNANRNLSFRSSNFEATIGGSFDILKYNPVYRRRRTILPYVTAGVGLLYFNPRGEYNGQWKSLRSLHTEGKSYSPITMVIPMGLGARIKVKDHWDVCLEGVFRYTFTDYLDDVSGTYGTYTKGTDQANYGYKGDYAQKNSDGSVDYTWLANRKRGNSGKNDTYYSILVRAEYTIKVTKQKGHTINRVYSPKFKSRRK